MRLLTSASVLADDALQLDTEFMLWLEIMSAHENLAGLMGQVGVACSCYQRVLICSVAHHASKLNYLHRNERQS